VAYSHSDASREERRNVEAFAVRASPLSAVSSALEEAALCDKAERLLLPRTTEDMSVTRLTAVLLTALVLVQIQAHPAFPALLRDECEDDESTKCASDRCIQDHKKDDCCEYVGCLGGIECADNFFSGIASTFNLTKEELLDCNFTQQLAGEGDGEDGDGSECFPAHSKVTLADGSTKTMAELDIGDRVVVDLERRTSAVHFFSHRETQTISKFIRIRHTAGAVTISPNHYLYANGRLVVARAVRVGDTIGVLGGSPSVVSSVGYSIAKGLYNPHTFAGTVMVDGVLTSCYTSAIHPTLAHVLLMPLRTVYALGVKLPGFLDNTAPSWMLSILPRSE